MKKNSFKITSRTLTEVVSSSIEMNILECLFEILNVCNYPLMEIPEAPKNRSVITTRLSIMDIIREEVAVLKTPFINDVVNRWKSMVNQGEMLEKAISHEVVDKLIEFADSLGLSASMTRSTRQIIAKTEQYGPSVFKRERGHIRYLDFIQDHPIKRDKLLGAVELSMAMAYLEGLEILKKASELQGFENISMDMDINLKSGFLERLQQDLDSNKLAKDLLANYCSKAQKFAEKCNFVGLFTQTLDEAIASYELSCVRPIYR